MNTTTCMKTVHLPDEPTRIDMTTPHRALAHLAITDRDAEVGQRIRRQAVRDAKAAGALVTEIAATLGTKNRNGLYQMLDETVGEDVPAPQLTPAIFIRGAGVSPPVWSLVTAAMQARGWLVVRDRTQAWHLARGRVPVVMVDLSHAHPSVGRVRARYNDAQEPELPLAGDRTVLDSLDPNQLALAVIDHLTPQDQPVAAVPRTEAQSSVPAAASTAGGGEVRKRSIPIPDALWDQGKAAVDAGAAGTLQELVGVALDETMSAIEHGHNEGRPFPAVARLSTGPRSFHEPTSGKARQITLPEASWARARAIVAAGYATSLPALFTRALLTKVTAVDASR